jgi:glycosyltransferase involved in cell wall biosynthesis
MSNIKPKTIFIHIAAYRDPELPKTINSALSRAQYPSRLIFGICLQDTNEAYSRFEYKDNPQFRIIFVPYDQSKGCCWARSQIDSLYRGEDYVLQLDSHHRFVPDWDTLLIEYLNKCPSKKPILSTYVNAYEPGGINDGVITDTKPCKMVCSKFENGLVMFVPNFVSPDNLNDQPQQSMFISGHFIFTYGFWKREVPYDPLIYFTGEEHTLAVRSFTNGWDIFYPPKPIVFHMYTRKGRPKQWDDIKDWWKTDRESKLRVHNILINRANLGVYGLGRARTMDEYQRISGVDYTKQTLSDSARNGTPKYITKLYNTTKSSFHTHDFKLWYEKSESGNFKFITISMDLDKVTLRDTARNIDISLEDNTCKWRMSNDSVWKVLDKGSFAQANF